MANKRLISALLVFLTAAVWLAGADELVHVLERGETIYTLARRYDVAPDLVIRYNAITDPTRLAVGTRIRIPDSYVVAEGEYVYSIARKLGVDWLELLEANGLDRNDVVRPGDVLLLPRGVNGRTGTPSDTGRTTAATDDPPEDPDAAASARPDAGAAVTGATTASAGSAATVGRSVWPHPGERQQWNGKFPGIVMRGSEGDEFTSVTDGLVEFVGPFSSFGKLILVRSENGYLYGYAGADRVIVRQGERVASGAVLGTVGFSPAFDSAMVLFTVWRNNRYVDPETAPRG